MADVMGNYSLSDLAAVTKGEEGFMGGNSGTWIILLFLFFLGFGGNGLFGKGNGVNIPAANENQVDQIANKMSTDEILAAIAGNRGAIESLARATDCGFDQVQSALCGVKSAVEQTAAQTNLSIAQLGNAVERGNASIISTLQACCCDMKTTMLNGFAGVDKTLCQTNFNMERGFNGVSQTLINGFSNLNNQNTMNTNAIIQSGKDNTAAILAYLNQSKVTELQEKLAIASAEISQRNQSDYILSQLKGCGCSCNPCC